MAPGRCRPRATPPPAPPSLFLLLCLLTSCISCSAAANSGSSSPSKAPQNPYLALGVRKGCSEKELREAYRKLAKMYHPDKNKTPEAAEMFRNVKRAYDLLSTPEDRRKWEEERLSARRGKQQRYVQTDVYGRRVQYSSGSSGPEPEAMRNTIRLTAANYVAFVRGTPSSGERAVWPEHGENTQFWLIYVHSMWCQSCEKIRPIWEEVASRAWPAFRPGDILQDRDYELAQRLGIRSVPALVAVKVTNGRERRQTWKLRRKKKISVMEVLDFAIRAMTHDNPIHALQPSHRSSLSPRDVASTIASLPHNLRVITLSARPNPSLAVAYAAMRIPKMRFFHVDARHVSVRDAVFDGLDLSEIERRKCDSGSGTFSPCIIIVREDGWPMEIISKDDGLSAHASELFTLLYQRRRWFVPHVDGSNYYDLCYAFNDWSKVPQTHFERIHAAQGSDSSRSRASSAKNSKSTSKSTGSENSGSSFCVISLAADSRAARRALHPLTSHPHPEPMGWVQKSRQAEFVEFFRPLFAEAAAEGSTRSSSPSSRSKRKARGAIPSLRAVVAIRPAEGNYAIFTGSSSGASLISWVQGLQNGSVPFASVPALGHHGANDDEEDEEDEEGEEDQVAHGRERGNDHYERAAIPFLIRDKEAGLFQGSKDVQDLADNFMAMLLGKKGNGEDKNNGVRTLWTLVVLGAGYFILRNSVFASI
eukprot:CAMPEP_0184491576 /NCGR_PEP_ID=MMETSP0113_2-20130426/20763_1 /TAXON_ID=91329 /ORGANISM="Norrisiella sphaerica, Strain BC52" /LENGTH=703 /DNA_ID=CAMNT_0026875995 /DNA_START=90 /DNA_END=2201 /DNA_ORIENTATION=+